MHNKTLDIIRRTNIQRYIIKTFEKLNLHPGILRTLARENYSYGTAIQSRVIPLATKGAEIIGISKSGTGKDKQKREKYARKKPGIKKR